MTSESRFDLSALPATCLDCKRVCSAIAKAGAMLHLLEKERQRLSIIEVTADSAETYLIGVTTNESLKSSSAITDGATQQIIDSYAEMSRMFQCGGNIPDTGECGIYEAMYKNPYR